MLVYTCVSIMRLATWVYCGLLHMLRQAVFQVWYCSLQHSRVASAAQSRFGNPELMLYDETRGRYKAAGLVGLAFAVMRVWARGSRAKP
jgi:hypothetical protein